MIFIIGLPQQHHSHVLKTLPRALKDEYITGIKLNRRASLEEIFEECLDTLIEFHRGRSDCFKKGLLVVGVTQPGEEIQEILSKFFPFALTKEINFPRKYSTSSAQARRDGNALFAILEKEIKHQVKIRNRITSFLGSKAARTPILLPLNHFGEDDLINFISQTWKKASEASDIQVFLDEESKKFETKFPFKKKNGSRTGFFQNSKDVWFRPPGRDLHGSSYPKAPGHLTTCFFNAILRIGGAIKDGFHYDCTKGGSRHVGTFQNCHGDSVQMSGRPHLNVYPNDFIR